MLIFATLGPSGTNHEMVTRGYLDMHGLTDARIVLVDSFDCAMAMMVSGKAHHTIQAAAHAETTETIAKAFFRHGIFVIDTFISPSRPLAVLTRAEVESPLTLGLQPATKDYIDTSRWKTLAFEGSIASVAGGLVEKRYDSGLTALDVAEKHPGRFRIDQVVGTVDDPWIVYGMERTSGGGLLAWPDSPAAKLYRRQASREAGLEQEDKD